MALRGPPAGRYGGAESPGQPSRERVDPGKADTAPKAAPGFPAGRSCLPARGGLRRGAVALIRGREARAALGAVAVKGLLAGRLRPPPAGPGSSGGFL